MKIIKISCSGILGSLLGFGFCYYIASEFMTIYFPNQEMLYYVILISTILFFIFLINLILFKKANKIILKFLFTSYFFLLFMVLFYRQTFDCQFIFNPLTGIYSLKNPEMLIQSLLNLVIFIPLGYFFKQLSNKYVLIISLIISFIIELVQGIFKLGYFDTFDILLYIIGIQIGYQFFKKRIKPFS